MLHCYSSSKFFFVHTVTICWWKKISYFILQNLLFIWCWDFVVVSLNQPWDFWPKNTIPTKWFAVNVMLVFIPEPPIVVRRNADTPPTSDPRRSWSNLYIFFSRNHFSRKFSCKCDNKSRGFLMSKNIKKMSQFIPLWWGIGRNYVKQKTIFIFNQALY